MSKQYLVGIIDSVGLNIGRDGEWAGRGRKLSISFINSAKKVVRSVDFLENGKGFEAGNIRIGDEAYMAGECTKVSTNEEAEVYAYFVVDGTDTGIPLNKQDYDNKIADEFMAREASKSERIIFSASWTVNDVLESAAGQEFLGIEDPAEYDIDDLEEKNVFGRIARTLEDVVGERGNDCISDALFQIQHSLEGPKV